jgi:hypothetical protein
LVNRKRTVPLVDPLPWKSRPSCPPPLFTLTMAVAVAEPPGPWHVSVNVLFADVRAPLLTLPDVARLPDQAPLAVHEVALADDHVSVLLAPPVTLAGFAVRVTVGGGEAAVVVTVTLRLADPPLPVQVKVKVLVEAVSAPLLADPDSARPPLHEPLDVQDEALVDDHVRVLLPPLTTDSGLAPRAIVGGELPGGTGVTETVVLLVAWPPAPVQVKRKVLLLAVRGSLVAVPDVGRDPVHLPPAVQELAPVDVQLNATRPPLVTVEGLAVNETCGAATAFLTCTTTLLERVALPAKSRATADSVWFPSPIARVSHAQVYGASASAGPTLFPSSSNCTDAIPILSVAIALTVVTPLTIESPCGLEMPTTGGITSDGDDAFPSGVDRSLRISPWLSTRS